MRHWWQQRSDSEKRLLQWALAVAAAALLWLWLWEPLQQSNAALQDRISQQQQTLVQLHQLAQQAQAFHGQTTVRMDGGSLLSLADRSARSQRLAGSLRRIQQDGPQRVSVWLEQASFDNIITWLESLNREQGVDIAGASINRGDQTGLVNVQVTLQAAGS